MLNVNNKRMLKIVCISDTHTPETYAKLPKVKGDILLHAGDHTYRGTVADIAKAAKALAVYGKNFKRIVTIPGNHERLMDTNPSLCKQIFADNGITFLHHEMISILGVNIFGSGYTPEFCNWALNVPRGPKLAALWAQVPTGGVVDILMTHGPAMGILDIVPRGHVGDDDLLKAIDLIKPKFHVCGHLHENNGLRVVNGITHINASVLNDRYDLAFDPISFEI